MRKISAYPVLPATVGRVGAQTLLVLQVERTHKKSGKETRETRYYISSAPATARPAQAWDDLIRGHWGGVEIRNHWRRDAQMGEDQTRSRKPILIANLALLRSASLVLIQALPELLRDHPLPCLMQILARDIPKILQLATRPLR